MKLSNFIKISPGFKAAVSLENELDNLEKVAGFIPTEVSMEVIKDFAKTIHPTSSDRRSRLIMGTYGTGKSHLGLVVANLFMRPPQTPQIANVMEKIDPDIRTLLINNRRAISEKFLVVLLYGDAGRVSDALMMGLRIALEAEGLEDLLPESAFDAALKRIEEVEKAFPVNYTILQQQVSEKGHTLPELIGRLRSYDRQAFELFCEVHPAFSSGSKFVYSTMLEPGAFYESVVKELTASGDYSGICVLWDEFGHKMEEVVKDPSGKEGEEIQRFAERCNDSGKEQIHLFLICHRSLKEYQDISRSTAPQLLKQQREEDLRKIEGRFTPFIMKNTDVETFQLIDKVIIANESSKEWSLLTDRCGDYFETLTARTASMKYFVGFPMDDLKETVVLGTYPLHPMATYALPAISEKVAQNNRTLFTCLCEDQPGSFCRFLEKTDWDKDQDRPPMFTADMLWEYFSNDVKQQERTYPIFRDYETLKARLDVNDDLGKRILKAVSVFRVINPSRFKITEDVLKHTLDISPDQENRFQSVLNNLADYKNANRVLMQMNDRSFRTAVSNVTESSKIKIGKLISDPNSQLSQPVQYLNRIWGLLNVSESITATSYWDEYGVKRDLQVRPISTYQLSESLHILTKDIGMGEFLDGLLLVVICEDSHQIESARKIAMDELSDDKYKQILLSIPKTPISFINLLMEHQALFHLKKEEASLYAEGGELHEEWTVWEEDVTSQLKDFVSDLLAPENNLLDYYWKGLARTDIMNKRKLKSLVTEIMRDVFPYCPYIGADSLAQDPISGNYGYRRECKDICMKLQQQEAAVVLYNESASAQKHVIQQLLKSNGILIKNNAGETIIAKPSKGERPAMAHVWDCITGFVKKTRRNPQEMKNLARQLRKPPIGLKCRVMPVFFAAAVHRDLALGNLSFEFRKNERRVEKIASFEPDTLEKVFADPDKYKLVYVDVSTNQNELLKGLAKAFEVEMELMTPPLERVKIIGNAIIEWWRDLPGHARLTGKISGEAEVFREVVFNPAGGGLDADLEKILLKDIFDIFDIDSAENKSLKARDIQNVVSPIRQEFENATNNLHTSIDEVFFTLFKEYAENGSVEKSLRAWFDSLPEEKQNYVFYGDSSVLVDFCRNGNEANENVSLDIAEKLTGLSPDSWADEMVSKFEGKLESAKNAVDHFVLPKPGPDPEPDPEPDPDPLKSNQVLLSLAEKEYSDKRIFEIEADLSENCLILENLLNAQIEQIGRSLSDRQKMSVLYRFVKKQIFQG